YNNYDNANFPGVLFDPDNEPLFDANPMSRHSYDQMEYVDGLGPVAFGGFTWGDSGTGWCFLCGDTWAFDHGAGRWTYLGGYATPDWETDGGVGGGAYATANGMLYTLSHGETWVFNPAQNSWQQLTVSGTPPSSVEHTMEYDLARNVIYLLGGNYPANGQFWRFDIATETWSRLTPSGNGPDTSRQEQGAANGPGLAFDTRNDVLLVYSDGNIWVYDPDANSWQKPALPGLRPTDDNYAFGRFRYDPVNDGAWLHDWYNGEQATWFYRYRDPSTSGAPPPSPRVSISASPPITDGAQAVTLSWAATHSTSCEASGDWSGTRAITGTEAVGTPASPVTFALECQGPSGTGMRTITVSTDGAGGGGTGGAGSGGGSNSSGGGDGSSSTTVAPWAILLLMLTAMRRQLRIYRGA
ncbi:MAG: hypothetical protein OET44_15415, partial [Gammaproteobacteria bacterium]|nr:hypothetical protein [Gammaproteobacteria bacterium]